MTNLRPAPLIFFMRDPIPILNCLWILLFIVPHADAETTVGGTIGTDTTWTLSGSPYIVTSAITAKGIDGIDGVTTLTIVTGIEVCFDRYRSMIIGASSVPIHIGWACGWILKQVKRISIF